MMALLLLSCLCMVAATSSFEQHDVGSSSTPRVRVPLELGGTVTVPCNLSTVVACRLSPQSVTFMAAGKPVVVAGSRHGQQLCSCAVPPADAASSAEVAFSADNKTWPEKSVAVVDYYATWSPSLGKRPYLSSDTTGQVVVSTDLAAGPGPLALSLQTSDGTEIAIDTNESMPVGIAFAASFSLASFPAEYDDFLTLTLTGTHRPLPPHQLRLVRVAPPPSTLRSFSWLDYSRRSIMINDKPFIPVGFYSSYTGAVRGGPPGSFQALLDDLSAQAAQGINVVMQYDQSPGGKRFSSSGCLAPGPANSSIDDCKNQTRLLLDHCDKIGIKVMLDVAATFRTIVCGHLDAIAKACPAMATSYATTANIVADAGTGHHLSSYDNVRHEQSTQLVRAGNISAAWEDVERIVAHHREIPTKDIEFQLPTTCWLQEVGNSGLRTCSGTGDHPALLGWYVCDDCMTSWIVAQRTAGTPTVDKV